MSNNHNQNNSFSKNLPDNPPVVTVCAKDYVRLKAIYENVEKLTEREIANLNKYFLLQTDSQALWENIDACYDLTPDTDGIAVFIQHHGRQYKLCCDIRMEYLEKHPNEVIYLSMRIHYKSSTWAAVVVPQPFKSKQPPFLEPAAPETESIER